MAYKPVPTIFFDSGVTNIRDVSLLDSNFAYVSQKLPTVVDYGADPTGVVDATSSFQAAADTARPIFVPQGIYLIGGQVICSNGTQFIGVSTAATLQPSSGLVTIGVGSIIRVTSTSLSPFTYRSGNLFAGLTFYYPNQLRTASPPTVYPATFSPDPSIPATVLAGCVWKSCQFVNSYIWIDALHGHLDFQFYDLVGAPIFRGIRTDGCGGTDGFEDISGSYYYWCQIGDAAAVWMQANATGLEIGRSDAVYARRVYFGNLNAGVRFFKGSVNTLTGPYGSMEGVSLDGNNYGIYSEETAAVGMNIMDMMCNSVINDIAMPAGGTENRLQVANFTFWVAKTTSVIDLCVGSVLRLTNGIIYTTSGQAVLVGAAATLVSMNNVRTAPDGAGVGFKSTAPISTLLLSDNDFAVAPIINNPAGTTILFTGNKNLADRDSRSLISFASSVVGIGATVNVASVTLLNNLGAIVRVESSGLCQGQSSASQRTEFALTTTGGAITSVTMINGGSGGAGTITHAVSVAGLVATITAALNSTLANSTLQSRVTAMGNSIIVAEG